MRKRLSRPAALVLGIAAILAALPADAAADRPVFVAVTGQGAIRLRLAAGVTAPCDSLENRMLFDGYVRMGRYEWATASIIVCYQHTSAAFPESDWSVAQLAPTITRRGPNVIRISTE
jgi:hypothetical protein